MRTPRADESPAYRMKITLRGSTPPIWRRAQVRGNTSFSRLYAIVQLAMGRTDAHLHTLVVHGVRYRVVEMEWERLGQPVNRELNRFSYEYDFGDGWAHDIVVEKILPPEPGAPYPRCIAGKRACPPGDVRGTGGYKDFVAVIRDPMHEQHGELLAWAGGAFDPEAVALTASDRALRGLPR